MKNKLPLTLIACMFAIIASAQNEKCGYTHYLEQRKLADPQTEARIQITEQRTQQWLQTNPSKRSGGVITIPVVVHVVYNTSTENISTQQIQSQIIALNEDFRLLNFDAQNIPSNFYGDAADCLIEFCLAQQDPNGSPTTGITRTYTSTTVFSGNNDVKFSANGGADGWDATRYLNIWVCTLGPTASGGQLLGYASWPSDLVTYPSMDGVVIHNTAFGYVGTATAPTDLGRTATHEVGHWLNLRHIWGDAFCGDDFVSDTPDQEMSNSGCPTYPHNAFNSCGTGSDGEMFMNYMDYPDDACLLMFTYGQSTRMDAALFNERYDLLSSTGCDPVVTGLNDLKIAESISVYPNPSTGQFNLTIETYNTAKAIIYNALGEIVQECDLQDRTTSINLNDHPSGVYIIQIAIDNTVITKKLTLTK